MKITLLLLMACSAFAQTAPGTQPISPGNKMDDQPSRTATPKNDRDRKRKTNPATVPPADQKTPASPTTPRTTVEPTDPTKPTVKPPTI